jgi:hypothetical protein
MGPYLVAAFIVVFVAIAIITAIATHKAEKKRTDLLAQIAAETGFDFVPLAEKTFVSTFGALPLFNKGHSKKCKNILQKLVRGSEVTLLDYQYSIGSGKHRQTYKVTVCVFQAANRNDLPDFDLQPEGFWHKIGSYLGFQDIDFESHPVFSDAYLLRGPNEAAIRAEFTPSILEFFEKEPVKWSVEARSNRIAVFRPSRIKPDDLRQFLADATRVFLQFAAPTSNAPMPPLEGVDPRRYEST